MPVYRSGAAPPVAGCHLTFLRRWPVTCSRYVLLRGPADCAENIKLFNSLTMKNLVLASILATFAPFALADVTINEPWARATVPGQPVGAVYMKVSSSNAVRLVDIQADVAKDVQVHTMKMENGVMKMRDHGELEVPAGQTVALTPGGVHLMLMGLKKPLVAGETVTVKMTFQDAKNTKSTSTVTVPIRAVGK